MKSLSKLALCLLLAMSLTVSAFAAQVPDSLVAENLNGQQRLVKTYTLSPEVDPDELKEEDFSYDGYLYTWAYTTKVEHPYLESKTVTETVTVNTAKNDLAQILAELSPSMPYEKGGFSGELALDHIIVYDYANGASYMLEDRGKYDYSLRLNETDGCLWVVKRAYNSDDIVASGKLLFADNCLQVAYDLKTNCESTPNTETSTSETENTLRTSDTVELIGYVGNSQTSWIELYESTDNKEPIATVPYDLIAALPGCDRKSEAFTFGYLDSITFYYGKIGAFCWCVAALPPAAGTGAANVCTSTDNGETWSISIPNALYTGTVIGAGFASEMVGFISYRYFFDNGPEIARTLDGGKTWARLELDIPEEYAQYNMQPQNPTFSGNDGNYPIILLDKDGNDRTMTLHTHDGGMTWIWPKLSAVDVS